MSDQILTQSLLKNLFSYSENGALVRLATTSSRAQAGAVAGTLNSDGYVHVGIEGKYYKAHRLIWLYHHGEFPPAQLDHVNRNRQDNRIENLRLATQAENLQNKSVYENNTSGYSGVSWNKDCNKWQAQITLCRKQKHLGLFATLEEAVAARKAAKIKYHQFQTHYENTMRM